MAHGKWDRDDAFILERRDLTGIRRVLIVTMVLNFVAMGVKLAAGLATGALSVVADSLDSFFDGFSNVVGLAGLYAAGKPPDANHPYGHRKFETLAALSISFLLFLTTFQLLESAWARLGQAAGPSVNLWTLVAMVASIVVQALTSQYELRAGRRLRSELLVADALHTRASILVSGSVLGGLGLVRLGFPQADPILAGFVALMIAKIGIDVIRETLPVLVDQAAIDPRGIADVVEAVDGIESFHRVRSRGPSGSAAVDLHVRVSPEKTVQEANAIADEVRRRLLALEGIVDVTVHVEAQRQPEPDAPDFFATIKHTAGEMGLTLHEVWAHRLGDDIFVEMHVGVDPDATLGEAHARVDRLEGEIGERLPNVKGIHTHIEMATTRILPEDQVSQEIESRVCREAEQVVARLPLLSHPHNIHVRRNPAAENKYYVSLDCDAAPDITVSQAHELASQLEQELGLQLHNQADVSVHLEPNSEG
jgi:cation diffusion facilitator family transporter